MAYHCFAQMSLLIETVSQVSDVAHGPLILNYVHVFHIVVFINFMSNVRNSCKFLAYDPFLLFFFIFPFVI